MGGETGLAWESHAPIHADRPTLTQCSVPARGSVDCRWGGAEETHHLGQKQHGQARTGLERLERRGGHWE